MKKKGAKYCYVHFHSWDSLVMDIGRNSIFLKMEDVFGSLLFEEMRRMVSLNSKEDLNV